MAKDLRDSDTSKSGLNTARQALIAECEREEENCLYTSTSFYIWLRYLRWMRGLLWALGALGSIISASSILGGDVGFPIIMAGFALAGVLMPGLIKALQLDETIETYVAAAATFKNLQGEFRRAAKVWSHKPLSDFEAEARKTLDAMNTARAGSLTPPEWCFRQARKKIKRGDYNKE